MRDLHATRRGFSEGFFESTVKKEGAYRLHRLRNIALQPKYDPVHSRPPLIASGLLSLDDVVWFIVMRDREGIGLESRLNGPEQRE